MEQTQDCIHSGSDDSDTKTDQEEIIETALNDVPHELKLYIHKMQDLIMRQRKKISKLKKKLSEQKNRRLAENKSSADLGIQTDPIAVDKVQCGSPNWDISNKENSGSIEEQVKQAAELALQQTGFVYEETSGLYYDYKSGYYYDANRGLYYDGHSGTYYYYDQDSQSYKFHSQTQGASDETTTNDQTMKKKEKRRKMKANKVLDEIDELITGISNDEAKKRKVNERGEDSEVEEPEEGECSGSSTDQSSSDYSPESSSDSESENKEQQDLAKTYPPCMRIIVKETNVPTLKVGSLFIVAYTGGSMGREGDHSVIIQDINISKHHARFLYDEEKKQYQIIDMASRNGTFLDGKRLSVAKQESDPHEIKHGSIIQVGSTKLSCHVHIGNATCGHCEPGLVQHNAAQEENKAPKKNLHKQELKRLKNKFGVEKDNVASASQLAQGYRDRAQARRECVGSLDHHAKTQQSTLESSITKDNKGFKLLSKMGWSEGQSLGKDGSGRIEPVTLASNHNKMGFGAAENEFSTIEVDSTTEKKQALWRKTQERYKHITD